MKETRRLGVKSELGPEGATITVNIPGHWPLADAMMLAEQINLLYKNKDKEVQERKQEKK